MAMYRFFQKEEDGPWHPIADSDRVLQEAKEQGAKKLTILAVNEPLGANDAKRGWKYQGPLYFDIDTPDVKDAIESARELVSKLVNQYHTPEEAIQVFCSGKKGLHVLVDQRGFMQRGTAIKDLPLIYKAMAQKLYVTGMDLGPYACGRNNTFRIANLKRYDGNYRVPIRITELLTLDADGYAKMVSKPRPEVVHPKYTGPHSIQLNVLYNEAASQVAQWERELTEKSRNISVTQLQSIADQAPPCVEAMAEYKGLKESASFNAVALNLALWASRAGAPDAERKRVFQMTADNADRSDRYPTPRSRLTELEGKYQFSINSPDYKFGCGAMRSLLKQGRSICDGCPLENSCKGSNAVDFIHDVAERAGISKNEGGYLRLGAKGKVEQLSTFTLEPEAAYMEDMPDGTGSRRRGTLCRVMRHGERLGTVIMDEPSWASKSAFLRSLEGVPGVYYIGGDAEVQKIKMLVFLEEEKMPEIHQVNSIGMHLERRREADIFTYVESGKSLNNYHMVDTHRLVKTVTQPPELFKQAPLDSGDVKADQVLANLCRSNQAPVVALALGWFVACHLKAHLRELYGQFPLLSLWGASGSGKSRLAEILGCLHGINFFQHSKTNCTSLNQFRAVELLSGSASVPRLCEEYNKDKMAEHQYVMLGELFKALWNCEAAQRGAVLPGQRTAVSIDIPLTSPCCILSEQQIKMPALMERTLIVKMTKVGRNKDAMAKVMGGRGRLMQLGQHLMQAALKLPLAKVEKMLELEQEAVGFQFDDRPRYSLMVVHMALRWLSEICADLRLQDSVTELTRLKRELAKITRGEEEAEKAKDELNLSSILGSVTHSEIDQWVMHLNDLATESGLALYEQSQSQERTQRKIWLHPNIDFKVSGDQLYLVGKACHGRYLEWVRTTGSRTPLQAWSDVKQLSENEPYFIGWKSLSGFAFGEPLLTLSIEKLRERGVDVQGMVKVYDVLGTIDLKD